MALFKAILIVCIIAVVNSEFTCPKGTYLGNIDSGKEGCFPCSDGTFMDMDGHRSIYCIEYTQRSFPGSLKSEVKAFTPTSNKVNDCIDNYDRLRSRFDIICVRCSFCREGEIEVSPCTKTNNRVCRIQEIVTTEKPISDMTLAVVNSEFTCPKGTYLGNMDSGKEGCFPCSDGTFMDVDRHRSRYCDVCTQKPLPSSLDIEVKGCTPTSNRVNDCIDNSFRLRYGTCVRCSLPCKEGEIEVSHCTKTTNRVCRVQEIVTPAFDDTTKNGNDSDFAKNTSLTSNDTSTIENPISDRTLAPSDDNSATTTEHDNSCRCKSVEESQPNNYPIWLIVTFVVSIVNIVIICYEYKPHVMFCSWVNDT